MKYAPDTLSWIRNMSPYGECQNNNIASSVWKETFISTDLPLNKTRSAIHATLLPYHTWKAYAIPDADLCRVKVWT